MTHSNETIEPVTVTNKLDWTDQWNSCDICEICGSLIPPSYSLHLRMSESITLLYTHGLLTSRDREHARKRLETLLRKTT